jgi:hypothetical protein
MEFIALHLPCRFHTLVVEVGPIAAARRTREIGLGESEESLQYISQLSRKPWPRSIPRTTVLLGLFAASAACPVGSNIAQEVHPTIEPNPRLRASSLLQEPPSLVANPVV